MSASPPVRPSFIRPAQQQGEEGEVVAQMLDYAANGSVFWTPEQLRTWFEGNDPAGPVSDQEPEARGQVTEIH